MNAIEQCMDVLWNHSEAQLSTDDYVWKFSEAFFDQVRAAVRPSLDPFGATGLRDKHIFGMPFIVERDQVDPVILEKAS